MKVLSNIGSDVFPVGQTNKTEDVLIIYYHMNETHNHLKPIK